MVEPYRRKSWLNKLQLAPKFEVPEQLERWLPDSHIRIKDAVDLLGQAEIMGWDGTEKHARWVASPPDRPWHWKRSSQPQSTFVISKDEEVEDCSEEEAEKWWKKIEPSLLDEWQQERAAKDRWVDCIELLRNRLAAGTYHGFALEKTGTFIEIPVKEWISQNGLTILLTGVAVFSVPGLVQLIPFDGPAVLKSNFLQANSKLSEADLKRLDRFPYLRLLLAATRTGMFKGNDRVEKKVIEHWLQQNWPPELGQSSPTKIATLATYLRRPADEKGGLSGKGPDR